MKAAPGPSSELTAWKSKEKFSRVSKNSDNPQAVRSQFHFLTQPFVEGCKSPPYSGRGQPVRPYAPCGDPTSQVTEEAAKAANVTEQAAVATAAELGAERSPFRPAGQPGSRAGAGGKGEGWGTERGEPLWSGTGKSCRRGAGRAQEARQSHAAFVQSWAAGGAPRAGARHTRDRAQSWLLLSGGDHPPPQLPQPLKAERARVSLGFRVSPAVRRGFCSSLPASQVSVFVQPVTIDC
ncbi:hypothetical protein R6Z07F_019188 [Ovis aries]